MHVNRPFSGRSVVHMPCYLPVLLCAARIHQSLYPPPLRLWMPNITSPQSSLTERCLPPTPLVQETPPRHGSLTPPREHTPSDGSLAPRLLFKGRDSMCEGMLCGLPFRLVFWCCVNPDVWCRGMFEGEGPILMHSGHLQTGIYIPPWCILIPKCKYLWSK